MHEEKFTVYAGKWPCKVCQEVVTSLRYWKENGNATWMCTQKHIYKVSLIPQKRTKKDFLNERKN
jgi:hypothetical protein